ncbi:MAG: ferredoxin [Omnitrophica bacterium RIFCSPHIGHO2_02_FULL_46_11]|nr:MAG: ferredoxin [Omnitrophica bacterium RIFCSPLOWO2_01_FULL_45_10b]OGW87942.1 MAG: ferredoxin [Omnitrophica bacterium RIFCSPHIGHO2_02_FULL_46_11]
MANRTQKLPESVAGKYYVDKTCIDCDLCRQTAPANFSRNAEASYSFVSKQPQTLEEGKLCAQAKLECPVDSIGDDGED